MRPIIGILSTALVVSNLIINSIPLFIMTLLRAVLHVLGLSRVRIGYTAGEAIGPDIFDFYRSIGINLKQLYGSTETSVFVTIQPDGQIKPDTVGVPLEGVELQVDDSGEVLIKSHGIFKEYFKNADATEEAKTGGWFVRYVRKRPSTISNVAVTCGAS